MRKLREGRYAQHIGVGAPVYLAGTFAVCQHAERAAVLEYLCAELLELSGNSCRSSNCNRIVPRDVMIAVRADEELNKLLSEGMHSLH
jgi:histone H2A